MSLEIAFTDAGLAFRREALKNGVPIKITHFKISKDDIDMSNLPTDLPSNWIEKPITYYTPIGTTGLQLDLWVNADEAIEQGKSFGVYLEDGTCYMLGRAVGLFNPNLKQKYKVLIEFVNSDLSSYDLSFVENLQQDWESIKNKPSFSLINTPTISVEENRAIVGYATNNTFNGVHDKTLIKLFEDENRTNLLKEYEVTSGDVANILLSDIPANTHIWGTLQVGSANHLSDIVKFEFTSMNQTIESPIFTVETDNGKAVNLADVTLNALPNSTNCTIDTVEFQIVRVSDDTVVDTQSTTNLTLPIVFESQNLEENTEYRWEIRCRDTSLNVDSTSSINIFTTLAFDILLNSVSSFYDFWNVSNPAEITYTDGLGFDKNSDNYVAWESNKIKRFKFLEFDGIFNREPAGTPYRMGITMYIYYTDGTSLRAIYVDSSQNYMTGIIRSDSSYVLINDVDNVTESYSLNIADKDIDSIKLQGWYNSKNARSYLDNIKFVGVELW